MFIKFSMPCHVVRQSASDTISLADNTQVFAHHVTAANTVEDKVVSLLFHRQMFFASFLLFPTMADDGFRYGM